MNNSDALAFWEPWLQCLKPDPILSVSEWADQHRKLPAKSAAEPGRWRTTRTPYLREIMDCLSATDPTIQVTFMKSAQIGGTECGNNWVGYVIDMAPGPMMCVQKTGDAAMKNSRARIDPLVRDHERLAKKVAKKNSKEDANTVLVKDFIGGFLIMTGANSTTGLRSLPIKYLFLDEVSSFEQSIGKEGDPVDLAIKRTETFKRKKVFAVSTPTVAGICRIEMEFLKSDMRRFHVPCPLCGHEQVLEFKQLKWEKGQPETAKYQCISCNGQIEEFKHKSTMLANGRWIASNKRPSNKHHAGFHINALYSPWVPWSDIAAQFLDAKTNPFKMQVFVNAVLGETWNQKGEAPEWRALYNRREAYETNTLPDGVVLLTAALDVQANRIECEIVGWGRDNVSWSIDYRIFEGDINNDTVWSKVERIMSESWTRTDGTKIPLNALAVDTGFMTQKVYQWCRRWNSARVYPVKGVEGKKQAPVSKPSMVDVRASSGTMMKKGLKIWPVAVDPLKEELYAWLKLQKPTESEIEESGWPAGFCHFPEYDEEYFQQLCAEHRVVKLVRGFKKYMWEKVRDRNEALDLRIYNRAAALILGIDRYSDKDWENLTKKPRKSAIIETNGKKIEENKTIIRRKSSFL